MSSLPFWAEGEGSPSLKWSVKSWKVFRRSKMDAESSEKKQKTESDLHQHVKGLILVLPSPTSLLCGFPFRP